MQTQTTHSNAALVTFDFEGDPVRIEDRSGDLWFVAQDVCRCLEVNNHRQALTRLEEDEKGVILNDTLGGSQNMLCVNEPGLYSLIFSSRKKSAKKFKRWVTHEVLPTIRKTGSYGVPVFDSEQEADDTRLYLTMVNECRRTFGRGAAQRLWRQLPLPEVEDGPQQIAGGDHAIGRFMAERTQQGDALKVRASQLYAAYAVWCGLYAKMRLSELVGSDRLSNRAGRA